MNNPQPQLDGQQALPPGSNQPGQPDILKVLWRWKWLPILGGLIGLAIGYLIHGQMPPEYKAVAFVQVQSPNKHFPIDPMIPAVDNKGKSDELVVIRSGSVLGRAVDSGKLTQHRALTGQSRDEIIGWLKKKKVLETKLGSTDPNSEILQIGVTTNDAELSGTVLNAIVSGYQQHTDTRLREASDDARTVLAKYNESYFKRVAELQDDIQKIRDIPELVFVEGKPIDPEAIKILKMKADVAEIEAKKRSVESLLEQIDISQKAGRPAEEALKLIASAQAGVLQLPSDQINLSFEKTDVRSLLAAADQFENTAVLPARIRLKNEKVNWGENHPRVSEMQGTLDVLEAELAKKRLAVKEAESIVRELQGGKERDTPSLQMQLDHSVGALKDEHKKLERERQLLHDAILALQPAVHENSHRISRYLGNLAEMEALSATSKEVSEALNRLNSNAVQNMKTVTILEQSSIGGFVGPILLLYLGVGAILGAGLFGGIAYLLELADRSYRSPDEIAADLGMPIIGHLPLASLSRTSRVDDKVDTSIVTLHKSRSAISEAFRGIRTAMFFSSNQGSIKVIQVTSPVPGDGKSTIAANLAVTIAQSGRKICIVDCDFRRPRVAKIFGLREDTGLVQVIGGKAELDDALQTTTVPNLYSLTCGRRPGNPAELLASERFHQIISELRERFDYVIVDTPPVLVVSDPAAVSGSVDGVILTVRLRRNLKPIAIRAAQMLHAMNANMLGVVVNGIGVGGNGYGYGGYRYDSYNNNAGYGYGRSGYGGYGYGSTFQYGGYYGGTMIGRDYYADQVPNAVEK